MLQSISFDEPSIMFRGADYSAFERFRFAAFGGTPPLDVEQARISNLEQFRRARACFQTYRSLLAHTAESIP